MLILIKGSLLSYCALLIFASCTINIRSQFWPHYVGLFNKVFNKEVALALSNKQIFILRCLSYGLMSLAIYQFSQVYGATIGISNWFCMLTVLASFVVATLSYARASLMYQIVISAVLALVSLIIF